MPHVEKPYIYEPVGYYPHLSPADVSLWERFVRQNPNRFLRVWYDFRVGEEEEVAEGTLPRVRQGWWDLTYWRIDVIVEDYEKFYVIEVKPNANAKAIGQAECYAALFEEDEEPQKPVVAVVLTDNPSATLLRIAKSRGVEIWRA